MPTPQERFDLRDLAAAARNSCRSLRALRCQHFKRPSIAVERGFSAGQRLPALDNHIHVLRVQLDADTNALGEFGGSQCRSASEERLVNQLWFRIGLRAYKTSRSIGQI